MLTTALILFPVKGLKLASFINKIRRRRGMIKIIKNAKKNNLSGWSPGSHINSIKSVIKVKYSYGV